MVECGKPFGHAAEPWNTRGILCDLERAVGDASAAAEAWRKAVEAYLAYRRAGGENSTFWGMHPGRRIPLGTCRPTAAEVYSVWCAHT